MDTRLIRTLGKEWLSLDFTETEAQELMGPLDDLLKLIRESEQVPLRFSAEPFISPRSADQWLERWPER